MPEHTQVFGDRWTRHGEPAYEVTRAPRPPAHVVEEPTAGGVGESGKGSVESRRLHSALSHGQSVTN